MRIVRSLVMAETSSRRVPRIRQICPYPGPLPCCGAQLPSLLRKLRRSSCGSFEFVIPSLDLLTGPPLEQPREGGAVAQKDHSPKKRHEQGKRKSAGRHEDVEAQDVDEDRPQQGERKRHVLVDEKQNRRNDLDQKDHDQVVGSEKRPKELAGEARGRGHGKEVQEPVQTENQEDEPQQQPGDKGCDFHRRTPFIDAQYLDINISDALNCGRVRTL